MGGDNDTQIIAPRARHPSPDPPASAEPAPALILECAWRVPSTGCAQLPGRLQERLGGWDLGVSAPSSSSEPGLEEELVGTGWKEGMTG